MAHQYPTLYTLVGKFERGNMGMEYVCYDDSILNGDGMRSDSLPPPFLKD